MSLDEPQTVSGLSLTPELKSSLIRVLIELYKKPCSCKGDYARSKAVVLAMAATEGLITTKLPDGYASEWRVSARGLLFLEKEM